MLSIHDIKMIIEEYKYSPSVAAERIHQNILISLITFNPVSNLPQTPYQVKHERDSLLLSVRALQIKIEQKRRASKNHRLTIHKLKDKLAMLEAALMTERLVK